MQGKQALYILLWIFLALTASPALNFFYSCRLFPVRIFFWSAFYFAMCIASKTTNTNNPLPTISSKSILVSWLYILNFVLTPTNATIWMPNNNSFGYINSGCFAIFNACFTVAGSYNIPNRINSVVVRTFLQVGSDLRIGNSTLHFFAACTHCEYSEHCHWREN